MKFKIILLLLISFSINISVNSQENPKKKIKVSGYLKDINDLSLKGVSIIINNIQLKTFTNKKGFYKIKVSPETKLIMAYSLTHGGIEIKFNGNKKINFDLDDKI